MTDTCICCGAPVPEGRMVCGACEMREEMMDEHDNRQLDNRQDAGGR